MNVNIIYLYRQMFIKENVYQIVLQLMFIILFYLLIIINCREYGGAVRHFVFMLFDP